MLHPVLFFSIVISVYAALEYYGWQAMRAVASAKNLRLTKRIYWTISITLLILFTSYRTFLFKYLSAGVVSGVALLFIISAISKLTVFLFLFPEDVARVVRLIILKFRKSPTNNGGVSRSEFLSKIALAAAALPAVTLIYGAVVNAYNYQYRKISIRFPNLPNSFHGFKIIQLSDIHSGSFSRTEPLQQAVKKINEIDADLIVFTGDLVNNIADEMNPFIDIFSQLKSKHGVMSVAGNHDYGDYVQWNTEEEKKKNFEHFCNIHKKLGWNLLLNENRTLEQNGEKISIIGVENWGAGRFSKYGKFDVAYKGAEESPFKILLSHDPSSWDARVRPEFPDIDLTLSGHTHGAQFGIENKWLRWSPSQYIYKQWAGLYNESKQYIYVN